MRVSVLYNHHPKDKTLNQSWQQKPNTPNFLSCVTLSIPEQRGGKSATAKLDYHTDMN